MGSINIGARQRYMQDDDVVRKLRDYLTRAHLPPGQKLTVRDDEDLFDAGVLDSAALLSFLAFIEAEFGLVIPDEDLLPEHFASVASTTKYIHDQTRRAG